jgi:hypothetical protein
MSDMVVVEKGPVRTVYRLKSYKKEYNKDMVDGWNLDRANFLFWLPFTGCSRPITKPAKHFFEPGRCDAQRLSLPTVDSHGSLSCEAKMLIDIRIS